MLVVQHRQNLSFLSTIRMMILVYFRTLANLLLEDDEVFASDMTDIRLQFHEAETAPTPVMFLQVVLQKFAIIESRAE